MDSLKRYLPVAPTKQRSGPNKRWVQRFRQDTIDWARYKQVWYRAIARDYYHPQHPNAQIVRAERRSFQKAQLRKGSSYVVHAHLPYPWTVGKDVDDWTVFEAVARTYSRRSIYGGSANEMKKSWERVTEALRLGEAWRYYPSAYVRFEGQTISADEHLSR